MRMRTTSNEQVEFWRGRLAAARMRREVLAAVASVARSIAVCFGAGAAIAGVLCLAIQACMPA